MDESAFHALRGCTGFHRPNEALDARIGKLSRSDPRRLDYANPETWRPNYGGCVACEGWKRPREREVRPACGRPRAFGSLVHTQHEAGKVGPTDEPQHQRRRTEIKLRNADCGMGPTP